MFCGVSREACWDYTRADMSMTGRAEAEAQFDDAGARKVEAVYQTPDVIAQRAKVLEALAMKSGERVVDLGCGPGLLALDLARQVGPTGAVLGIDSSESMIALARRRCGAVPQVSIGSGDVSTLPYDDRSFDAAVCTQVYEYVSDVDRALRELKRVLRPGGRAVIVDTDWESCVWHSSDDARMRGMIDCWDTHCPNPHLPRVLGRRLRDAGLTVTATDAIAIVNAAFDPNTYSAHLVDVIAAYARKHLDQEMVEGWVQDLLALAARGEYFFSLNRYLFAVRA